jgi:hypothetical protein
MAQLGKYYGSGRSLSLKNSHHRALMMLCALVSAAFFISELSAGESLFDSVLAAANMGISMGIAWAITREIDPDRPDSGIGAAALAAVGIILLDASPNLIAGYALLLTARCVNQVTGVRFKIIDVLLTVIMVGITAQSAQWVIGLMAGLGFLLDSVSDRPSRYARLNAAIVVALTLILAYLSDRLAWSFVFTNADIAALLTAFVVTRFVVPTLPDPLQSMTDYTDKPLNRQRVLYAITLMALTLILVSWSGDDDAVFGILPLWAGLIAVIAYHARDRFTKEEAS